MIRQANPSCEDIAYCIPRAHLPVEGLDATLIYCRTHKVKDQYFI